MTRAGGALARATDRCALIHCTEGRLRARVERPELFAIEAELGAFLEAIPGVESVRINRHCRSVAVEFDPELVTAAQVLELLETSAEKIRAGARPAAPGAQDGTLGSLGIAAGAAALGLAGESLLAPWLLAAAALPIFRRAAQVLCERRLGVDVLDASATAVLVARDRLPTAAVMVGMVALGDYLRGCTRRHSVGVLTSLYGNEPARVWRVHAGRKERVAVAAVRRGDEVAIYPGEVIPLDGTVSRGEGLVDQRLLSGEALPVRCAGGSEVFAGTLLAEGRIYVRAERIGSETRASQILRLVLDAPASETRAQNYAERFADRLVPWSLLGAAGLAGAGGGADAVASLLIADFGTGIRIAAPTTVLAALARAAGQGVLIKGGRALERLAEVDAVVFDKTGTLTEGVPEISEVLAYEGREPDEVLAIAAAAENRLTHPAAEAVVRAARARGLAVPRRKEMEYRIGLGVSARIGGAAVRVGSRRFLEASGVDLACGRADLLRAEAQEASQLLVALEGRLAGMLLYRDRVRGDAAQTVRALHARGVREIVMLTGDRRCVAEGVAARIGIARVIAGAFPERKAEVVKQLQREGRIVAVVGDGINDSPALALAHVGIAMHGGSDIARHSADVTLLGERLGGIPLAIDLARESMARIRAGWRINCWANWAAIALSLGGAIGPIGSTSLSNGAALASALNGLRLLTGSPSRPEGKPDVSTG